MSEENAQRRPAGKKPAQLCLASSFPSVWKTLACLPTGWNSLDTVVPPAKPEVPALCSSRGSIVDGVRTWAGWEESVKKHVSQGRREESTASSRGTPGSPTVLQAPWAAAWGLPGEQGAWERPEDAEAKLGCPVCLQEASAKS